MKTLIRKVLVFLLAVFLFVPFLVSAHQPRITGNTETIVENPEISKAYYSKLKGAPQIYTINATSSFDLYVNILIPDIADQKTDVTAYVFKGADTTKPLAVLGGLNSEWKKFHEPFGNDNYLMGPEYKTRAEAGQYRIEVISPNNDSKYSLAIGEIESFNLKETVNAVNLIPKIKKTFFNESPINFIFSPFGIGYIFILFIFAFIFGFLYHLIMKKIATNSIRGVGKNIDKKDRLIRALLGVVLLLWAITTSWNPVLIFFAGFCFFEAIFSWCGFYAAIGKSTCPIE